MADIQNDIVPGQSGHDDDHNELHDLVRDLQKGVTKANLRSTDVAAGDLSRVTDDVRGLWMYQGSQWFSLAHEEVDVRAFGAVLDDSTDDSSAIQSAIDAFGGARGIVRIPGLAYCGTTSIDAKRAYLVGNGVPGVSGGRGSHLRFDGTAGISSSLEDNFGFGIRDLAVVGANGGTPTASGQTLVDFTGQNYPKLDRVRIRRGETGVLCAPGSAVEVHYGRFFGVDIDDCLTGWKFTAAGAGTHLIAGGRTQGGQDGAIIQSGAAGVTFVQHSFEGHSQYGIHMQGDTLFLLGNHFESVGATSLKVDAGVTRVVGAGNMWSSAATSVDDANSPTVVFGIGLLAGTSVDNRLDDLKLNEDLVVGDGSQAEDRIIKLASPAGQVRDIRVYSGDPSNSANLRWIIRVDGTAESGSNSGSDLKIFGRNDSGGSLGTWMEVIRSSGKVTLAGSELDIDGNLNHDGSQAGFFNAPLTTQPSLTYSRGSETTAEAQLRTALASLGLVADNTTA